MRNAEAIGKGAPNHLPSEPKQEVFIPMSSVMQIIQGVSLLESQRQRLSSAFSLEAGRAAQEPKDVIEKEREDRISFLDFLEEKLGMPERPDEDQDNFEMREEEIEVQVNSLVNPEDEDAPENVYLAVRAVLEGLFDISYSQLTQAERRRIEEELRRLGIHNFNGSQSSNGNSKLL